MTVRSFVAVFLTPEVRAALGAEIQRLRGVARDVAWVTPENLHVTLKFLGGVEEGRLDAVAVAVDAAASAATAFDLAVEGLGAFPTPARPRVVWAGLGAGACALAALATRLDAALASLGFPREERPFSGHVTLGRARAPRRDPALMEALAGAAGRRFGHVPVAEIALMRSDLSPKGPRYTALRTAPLVPS